MVIRLDMISASVFHTERDEIGNPQRHHLRSSRQGYGGRSSTERVWGQMESRQFQMMILRYSQAPSENLERRTGSPSTLRKN